MQNDKGVVALKSYEERIAELDAKREQKEKELAQLKARQKKLQQQQKALERKARKSYSNSRKLLNEKPVQND